MLSHQPLTLPEPYLNRTWPLVGPYILRPEVLLHGESTEMVRIRYASSKVRVQLSPNANQWLSKGEDQNRLHLSKFNLESIRFIIYTFRISRYRE